MKHLAQIQTEFAKLARDGQSGLGWWEAMPESEQREYLQNHPKSRMRLTPRSSKDPKSEVTSKYPKAHAQFQKALRAGERDAWVIHDHDLSDSGIIGYGKTEEEAWQSAAKDTPEKIDLARKHVHDAIEKLKAHPGDAHADTYIDGPGDSRVDIRPGGSNFSRVFKKNDQLFEHVPRRRGDEKDIPINPDEAASILRHHMGFNPIDPNREREERFTPVDERPRHVDKLYNPRPPESYDPGPGSLAYSD